MYLMMKGCNKNDTSNKINNTTSRDSSSSSSRSSTLINRTLKPLLPRKHSSSSSSMAYSLSSSHHHHPYMTNEFIALNHHFAVERYKKEMEVQQQKLMSNVGSSRWNPTPEQLNCLEDIYRRGIRTPSSEQIQEISSQLRRFGKIEGKNVFYWFQNHKARERQKRRRQQGPNGSLAKSGLMSRTSYEDQETKNWSLPPNSSSTTLSEESILRAAREGAAEGRLTVDGLITSQPVHVKHATCPTMNLSKTTLENDETNNRKMMFSGPYNGCEDAHEEGGTGSKEASQTLDLFPLRSNEDFRVTGFGPVKFFEFLPLKS